MDKKWNLSRYEPSVEITLSRKNWERPAGKELSDLVKVLRETSKDIKRSPYTVLFWLKRSRTLLELGYPELSVQDAYRARVLLEMAYSRTEPMGYKAYASFMIILQAHPGTAEYDPDLAVKINNLREGKSIRRGSADKKMPIVETGTGHFRRVITIVLIESLLNLGAYNSALELSTRELRNNDEEDKTEELTLLNSMAAMEIQKDIENRPPEISVMDWANDEWLRKGKSHGGLYPWMTQRMQELYPRNDDPAHTTACFEKATNGAATIEAIPSSPLARRKLLATKHISSGQAIVTDPSCATLRVAIFEEATCHHCGRALEIKPGETLPLPCCRRKFCSLDCAKVAEATYHHPRCGKALPSFEFEMSDAPAMLTRLMNARVYNVIEQAGMNIKNPGVKNPPHPLEDERIREMFKTTSDDEQNALECGMARWTARPWNYITDCVYPFQVMRSLDMDPYDDSRCAPWIFEVLQHKIWACMHIGRSPPLQYPRYTPDAQQMSIYPLVGLFERSRLRHLTTSMQKVEQREQNVTMEERRYAREGCCLLLVATRDIKAGEELVLTPGNL